MSTPPLPAPFVLVVEDDRDGNEILQEVLRHEGFEVQAAWNGVEALERLRARKGPAIVLLDLMMPVMDGFQVLEAIRVDPALWQADPIVMTAAFTSLGKIGVAPLLRKPLDLDEVIELVRTRWKRLVATAPGGGEARTR